MGLRSKGMRARGWAVGVAFFCWVSSALAVGGSETELPPGCVKQPGPGGCAGKSRIEAIAVTPAQSCLHVLANNCNGGVLVIENGCAFPLELGELRIGVGATAPDNAIELFRDATGKVKAKHSSGNYASYSPAEDDGLSMMGRMGKVAIRVGYRKTRRLCE